MGAETEILLYTTAGCHLCEQAEAILHSIAALNGLPWRPVDIAEDAQLVERFGVRIPVVEVAGAGADIGWPFTPEQLADYLEAHYP